jgi:hypothetical protein
LKAGNTWAAVEKNIVLMYCLDNIKKGFIEMTYFHV